MSHAQLENRVAGYLRDSLMLQEHWQKPITAEQLQAEMDRMARDTKQPEILRELFEALGNDPAVIAECLARPILAERLIADLSAQDQTRHVESPETDALRAMSVVTTLGQVVYTLPEIAAMGDPPCTDDTWAATTTANAPSRRKNNTAVWTGSEMIVWGGYRSGPFGTNSGGRYNPGTDSWAATSTFNAPDRRLSHTAIWTGSEMVVWGGYGGRFVSALNTGGRYCGQYPPPLTIIQPNGGEVWLMGSVHQIKWDGNNLKDSDHLIIQYSRDGGAGWFRIAQDIPVLSFSYSWHVDNFPTTQGRVKILLQRNRSITDRSDANFTVRRSP
jgi:hypothetical protein